LSITRVVPNRAKYLQEIFRGKRKGLLLLVESLCNQKFIKESLKLNYVIAGSILAELKDVAL